MNAAIFASLKRLFLAGRIGANGVFAAVERGWIRPADYEALTGNICPVE